MSNATLTHRCTQTGQFFQKLGQIFLLSHKPGETHNFTRESCAPKLSYFLDISLTDNNRKPFRCEHTKNSPGLSR